MVSRNGLREEPVGVIRSLIPLVRISPLERLNCGGLPGFAVASFHQVFLSPSPVIHIRVQLSLSSLISP